MTLLCSQHATVGGDFAVLDPEPALGSVLLLVAQLLCVDGTPMLLPDEFDSVPVSESLLHEGGGDQYWVKKGKVFYGQEPPSGESTTTECGVNYQLLSVITEVAQWGTPGCSRPQPATDNGVRDGRSN